MFITLSDVLAMQLNNGQFNVCIVSCPFCQQRMGWFVMNPNQDETDIYLIDNGGRSGPESVWGGLLEWTGTEWRRESSMASEEDRKVGDAFKTDKQKKKKKKNNISHSKPYTPFLCPKN